MNPSSLPHFSGVGPLLLFAVGLALTGWGGHSALKSRQAASWPSVEGTVAICRIGGGRGGNVEVSYSYVVRGERYSGDRIAFGDLGLGNPHPLYKKLSGAQTVAVRYDPANPEESVLSYGLNRSTLVFLILGSMFIVFAAGFISREMLFRKIDQTMLDGIEVRERRTANDDGFSAAG
jgi:hypothetical protein